MTELDASPRARPARSRASRSCSPSWRVAAGLRLYRLADLPPGLFIDQAQYGLDAYRIARGETFPVFVEGPGGNKERGREPLFMYLMAGIFLVAGPTPVAIKLTSALIGIATVIVTYFAASRFFGERAGLCAAALLAVSRWHVTFSRMGFRAILAPLWVSLVALALWWLVRRRSRGAAVLFGVVVGAGFYTYPAYWSVPPALALVAAVALWERRGTLHAVARQVKPLVVAATVVVCAGERAPRCLRHHPRRGSPGARARGRAGRRARPTARSGQAGDHPARRRAASALHAPPARRHRAASQRSAADRCSTW